jgi:predicted Rossmann fold flavoprotein
MRSDFTVVVIGGGAAGFFAAVTAAQANPQAKIILLEKSNALLSKVRISGGGRCNVTHDCFDPKLLVKNYPRGEKALLGPFHRFQPRDTIQWFEWRGVQLKTEEDGRVFPTTDLSQTIIDCLLYEAKIRNVHILLRHGVKSIQKMGPIFSITLADSQVIEGHRLIIATGGNKEGFELARSFGHHIVPPVPSLFTFNIPHSPLSELAGISVEKAQIKIANTSLVQSGPLLITHWGFSGPAVLKLSAWGARELHAVDYQAKILINWLPEYSQKNLIDKLIELKQKNPTKTILTLHDFPLARQLWKYLLQTAGIDSNKRFSDISHKALAQMVNKLQADSYDIKGKTTHKQEFVTCGGVCLDEVDFKTLESRLCSGLLFAGEILDIDGITGGFNFQNAWTTGWIAGQAAPIAYATENILDEVNKVQTGK